MNPAINSEYMVNKIVPVLLFAPALVNTSKQNASMKMFPIAMKLIVNASNSNLSVGPNIQSPVYRNILEKAAINIAMLMNKEK